MLKQKRSAQENDNNTMSKRHKDEKKTAFRPVAIRNSPLDGVIPAKDLALFFKNDPAFCSAILAQNLNAQIMKTQEAQLPPAKRHPWPPLPLLPEWVTGFMFTPSTRHCLEKELNMPFLGRHLSNYLNDKILAARESRKNRILTASTPEPLVEQFLDVIFVFSYSPMVKRDKDTALYCELSYIRNYTQYPKSEGVIGCKPVDL